MCKDSKPYVTNSESLAKSCFVLQARKRAQTKFYVKQSAL